MCALHRKRNVQAISGTKTSLQNGQFLVSSGNTSLDEILNGGLQIGTILLIEEDKYVVYSKALARYFLAEGCMHEHKLFVANLDEDPKEFVKKIPTPCADIKSLEKQDHISLNTTKENNMRIAWRYNNLPQYDEQPSSTNNIERYFDISKTLDSRSLAELKINLFGDIDPDSLEENIFTNKLYGKLLATIKEKLNTSAFTINNSENGENDVKNIMRINLMSLGSPSWYDDNFSADICRFLTILKTLVRTSLAVCCITMPTYLIKYVDERVIHRIRNIVDYAIELESFAGSDKETNPIFKEYHGLLYIRKIGALNTMAAISPETHDLAFKLKRKQFVIEKLHLPPELQDPETSGEIVPSLSCGSTTKSLLEF